MNVSDLQQVLRGRADEASTDHPDVESLVRKGRLRRRKRRAAALASAGVVVAAIAAIPVLVGGGSDSGDAPATLVPIVSAPPSPIPIVSPSPAADCPAPLKCGALQVSPFPSSAATATAVPDVTFHTGISDAGPQEHATRWMNVNSWTTPVSTPLYLNDDPFLTVYAGGATIDPSLMSDATLAAVLVITPLDYYRFGHDHLALDDVGTIYRPSPAPQGKLKVISVTGSLLTLNLVGTSQDYVFNAATDTFQ
jgi:hypothetical protein